MEWEIAMNFNWQENEQPAGEPLVPTVDGSAVDARRRAVYHSYEGFLRQRLKEMDAARPQQWSRDYSSPDAYRQSIEPMRRKLKEMLGFWAEPEARPALNIQSREPLLETDDFLAIRFSLEVLPGLETYGLELQPKSAPPHPGLLVQHGYGGSPELVCGFTPTANAADYAYRSLGIRAVLRGYRVAAIHHPTGYGAKGDTVNWSLPGFPNYPSTYGKNRLHRLAVMAGGTLFGLDMMASSRGIDFLMQAPGVDQKRIGMYGLSQGGQSALYLPALDTRIQASVSSAYFNSRTSKLIGPHRALTYLDSTEEDKFFTHVIPLFSDSDIVSLIAPRAFAVEAGQMDSSVDFE